MVEHSNISEHLQRIKILFIKKLSADCSHGMLAIIWCRMFVFQFAVQKYKGQDI